MTSDLSVLSPKLRPHLLTQMMVKMLVPSGVVGVYALITYLGGTPQVQYVGRSECLRRRLLDHARAHPGWHFVIKPCRSIWSSATAEYVAYRRARPPRNQVCPADLPSGHPLWPELEWPVPRYVPP